MGPEPRTTSETEGDAMDEQTWQAAGTVLAALLWALLGTPRRRRLLALLKGALVGAVTGAVLFGVVLCLQGVQSDDPVWRWLMGLGASCGAFYGIWLGVLAAAVALQIRLQRERARAASEDAVNRPPSPPSAVS